MGANGYEAQCTEQQCPPKSPLFDFAPRPDMTQCCRPLVKTKCEVIVNGVPTIYKEGESWSVSGDPCRKQKCVRDSSGAIVETIVEPCSTKCDKVRM